MFARPTSFILPALLLLVSTPMRSSAQVRVIEPRGDGSAGAVVVKGRGLVHTFQILPVGDDGRIVGRRSAAKQVDRLFKNLADDLKRRGSSLKQIVKLNVYGAGNDALYLVRKRLAKEFAGKHKPAVSYVVTALPRREALVAVDAVAARPARAGDVDPAKGRLVYISGQAIRSGDLAESTRKTMQGLHRTLKQLKLNADHVMQVKTFFKPMRDVAIVNREIAKFSSKTRSPVVSHVEWTSRLIEIELVAFAPYRNGEKPGGERLRFVTPPWMKSSPVFSRVAVVESDTVIFVSGLYGEPKTSAERQVRDIFGTLRRLTTKAGGDLKHLAKATYYVSTAEASGRLNKLRPEFYDPKRPPAASKAPVAGVGRTGCAVTLDIIAVPAK